MMDLLFVHVWGNTQKHKVHFISHQSHMTAWQTSQWDCCHFRCDCLLQNGNKVVKTFTCGEAGEHVSNLLLKKAQTQSLLLSSLCFPVHLQTDTHTHAHTPQRSQARNHTRRTTKAKENVIAVICVLTVKRRRWVCAGLSSGSTMR